MKKVIIIGAGTIGLHSAYFLRQRGLEVEVLESNEETDVTGCSYGNCGLVVPSHFIPMASPAMLRTAFQTLFDRKGPVRMQVFKNLKNVPWFLQFMQSATQKHVKNSARLLYDLNEGSKHLYEQLNQFSENQTGLATQGLVMATTTKKALHEEVEVAKMAADLGIKTRVLDQAALQEMEPDIKVNVMGGVLYEHDANVNPPQHLIWLKKYLKHAGVTFRYGTQVSGFKMDKGLVSEVVTSQGSYKADEIVLATGAFSSMLAHQLGIKVPVISGKGYSIDLPKSDFNLRTPIILTDERVAITPFENTVRLGSGMEFNGTVGDFQWNRIQTLLNRTRVALPDFPDVKIKEWPIWEGLRPLSTDGVPFIGRSGKIANVNIAAGHAMMGMSLAPITGKMISQIIMDEPTGFDMKLLSPDRF